jgi:hypothetical protein
MAFVAGGAISAGAVQLSKGVSKEVADFDSSRAVMLD